MAELAVLQRFANRGIHRLILGTPLTAFGLFRWSLDRLAGLRDRTLA
jgi:hypothetical protein